MRQTKRSDKQSPVLRLFLGDPDSGPQRLPTLTQFYKAYGSQFRHGADPKTVEQDEQALRHWKAITHDPPLDEITRDTGHAFLTGLEARKTSKGKPIAKNTIRKTVVHIQFILDYAGPPARRERECMNMLEHSPYLPRPKATHKEPTVYLLTEIGQLIEAGALAYQAKNLHGIPAAIWWRSLITFLYNTALRIDTAMEITWEMLGRNTANWLSVPADLMKGGEFEESFYCNRWALASLDAIRRPAAPSQRIFDWTGWPDTRGWFYTCLRRYTVKSGLPTHRQALKLHGLRRSVLTWITTQSVPGVPAGVIASLVAGHHGGNVTRDAYLSRFTLIPPVLDRVPQPGSLRQQSLF